MPTSSEVVVELPAAVDLHARPAADFVRTAMGFEAEIVVAANDLRDLEDMPPVPHGDGYLQPLNFAPLGTEPAPPKPQPQPQEPDAAPPGAQQNDGGADAPQPAQQ